MKKYSKTLILSSIIIILVLLNATLLYQNYQLKKDKKDNIKEVVITKGSKLKYFSLKDIDGRNYTSENIISENDYTLFILFSLYDCPSCLMEKIVWEEIHKMNKVKVMGIVSHDDEIELKSWIENSNLSFTTLHDKNEKVTEFIKKQHNINVTPLKILVARSGEIVLINASQQDPNRHRELISIIDSEIQDYKY
ncbi:MAG: redoxin domain-containing protein [Bacteroidota bacterium]|nr:redoxin domain-containing protein [Bacteroidota bacterium]